MIREVFISIYLLLFKVQFYCFKCFPKKSKIVFCVSFSENIRYIAEEIKNANIDRQLVFLCRGECISVFRKYERDVIPFETLKPMAMLRSAYHLATAETVIVDNYFGFLSAVRFKRGVQCIQVWHAAGAIKTFGLEDRSVELRSRKAKQRFIRVYHHFDKIVVGSECMANIFMRSFDLPHERVLPTGVPRTDLFFNEDKLKQIRSSFDKKLGSRKRILYAPTFRDGEENNFQLKLDLNMMEAALSDQYLVMLRLHPQIQEKPSAGSMNNRFVYDYSLWPDANELLIASDILITDYSSIPFEYALLKKPMIFYLYDLESYRKKRGIQPQCEEWLPGPIARTTEQVIDLVNSSTFDMSRIISFSDKWNTYSDGHASYKFVQYIKDICRKNDYSK